MRDRLRLGWVLAAGALLVGSYGVADAQPGAAPKADTAVGMQRQVQLSPQEQVAQADTFIARMDATSTTVRRQLEEARARRDVVRTLCLNDKLNQVDVAIRSARDRKAALDQAAKRGDADLANHEFTVLGVLRQRVEQLGAEANQCIGEEAGFVGESKVTVTIDPNLPQQDPAAYPESPVVSTPPQCASCFK